MNTQTEMTLVPNRRTEKTKSFTLREHQWSRALKLSTACGYSPNGLGGFDRTGARCFAQALSRAIGQGEVDDNEDHSLISDLVDFLNSDGAGGFLIERGWQSWRRAG